MKQHLDSTADLPDATIDIALQTFAGDELHQYLRRLNNTKPVTAVRFLGLPAWLITDYSTILAAFRDEESFPPADIYKMFLEPLIGQTFQTRSGADHQFYRKMATPGFRVNAIKQHEESVLSKLVNEIIDSFSQRAGVDLVTAFTQRLPYLVITRLLGIPPEAEEKFFNWAGGILSFAKDPLNAQRCSDEMSRYLAPVLDERRISPGDDIISDLLRAEVDGERFSLEELFATVKLMFSAGAATTHDALGSLIWALQTTPGAWQRIIENPAEIPLAVDELLRFESPVAILPRTSSTISDCRIADVTIPANSIVLLAIAAGNRDPKIFAEPDKFIIGRDCTKALTFGTGQRRCPGLHLAKRQLQIAIKILIERLPNLHLLEPLASAPLGTVMRGPRSLPIRLTQNI